MFHFFRAFGLVSRPGAGTAHQNPQFAQFFVIDKEFACHGTLVTQHVDQETQGPQAVPQLFKGLLALFFRTDIVHQEALDGFAHAQHGERGLVQTQHRQHSAHLGQTSRYGRQRRYIFRVAEKLIHSTLGLAQRGAQLTHHTAHGLVVADAPVQLFHPGLKWIRFTARRDMVQSIGQPLGPGNHLFFRRIRFFQSCLQVQHGCSHFHGQCSRGRFASPGCRFECSRQCLGQAFTVTVQFAQGVAHQTELVCRRLELVAISPGQCRPGFCRCRNALTRLGQNGGIESAKPACFVIHRRRAIQVECFARRTQIGNLVTVRRLCLRTEEQQILHQPIRNTCVAAGQGSVLHEDARGHPFGVDIRGKQPAAKSLEIASADFPERTGLAIGLTCNKSECNVAQIMGRIKIGVLDNFQNRLVKACPSGRAISQRCCGHLDIRLTETPLDGPQIGRMNALGACQCLYITVLRKQGYR